MIMVPDQTVIHQTRNWIRDVVVGCNFCPFAARELHRGSIHYQVVWSTAVQTCLEAMVAECRRLDDHPDIETTLIILPESFADFTHFLELADLAEALLPEIHYEGIYQVASFHPQYLFADSEEEDPANYTNRSPYPMLHLLREAALEKVLEHYPDPENIPERNMAYARQRGLAHMELLLAACLSGPS